MQDTFSNVDLLFIDEKSMGGQKNYNIHHGQQTPPGDTPTPQGQVIWKSIGGLLGGLHAAATSLRFSGIQGISQRIQPIPYF